MIISDDDMPGKSWIGVRLNAIGDHRIRIQQLNMKNNERGLSDKRLLLMRQHVGDIRELCDEIDGHLRGLMEDA